MIGKKRAGPDGAFRHEKALGRSRNFSSRRVRRQGFGWSCDVWSEHHGPVSIGTAHHPVAGPGGDIGYGRRLLFQDRRGGKDYFVTGLGEIREL